MWSHCLRRWVSVWDEKSLKMNNSDGCTALWIVLNATEAHILSCFIYMHVYTYINESTHNMKSQTYISSLP